MHAATAQQQPQQHDGGRSQHGHRDACPPHARQTPRWKRRDRREMSAERERAHTCAAAVRVVWRVDTHAAVACVYQCAAGQQRRGGERGAALPDVNLQTLEGKSLHSPPDAVVCRWIVHSPRQPALTPSWAACITSFTLHCRASHQVCSRRAPASPLAPPPSNNALAASRNNVATHAVWKK